MHADHPASPARTRAETALRALLLAGSLASLLLFATLLANHLFHPLHLDLMEGTVLQHFHRALRGEPIYPAPGPEFVPLAYNVLYYYAAIPLAWLFGSGLEPLRLLSLLAIAGICMLLYRVAHERSGSRLWAVATVGLFAAAYRAMDAYLDTAHSDACFLLCALLGTRILQRAGRARDRVLGVVVLVLGFWFKQHGAWFAIGGVLWLTWHLGLRAALPYWALAALLGPGVYLGLGPRLFGSHFLYFTLEVPGGWSDPSLQGAWRLACHFLGHYPLHALVALALLAAGLVRRTARHDVWVVQLGSAGLTAVLGTLDAGSANNVYAPLGTFVLLLGTSAFGWLAHRAAVSAHRRDLLVLALLAYLPLANDPRRLWVPSGAAFRAKKELVAFLNGLDGPVFAPSLGYLPGCALRPPLHWVALEDMVRGPGRDPAHAPVVAELLAEVRAPEGAAYVLANHPLDGAFGWLGLAPYYELREDLGDRFRALDLLPKRAAHGWPRYLYRHRGRKG
ncbi:MAG: hypothetical protein IT458_14080 [Planctomycetes bacterium]|nr:hypothetical protein [Planctomycetota bacterium]